MSKKDYISRIEAPERHTTANGASYVTPFDIVRSRAGRELIDKFASSASSDSAPPRGNKATAIGMTPRKKAA